MSEGYGGGEFGRLAHELLARILDGTYPPGAFLPPQRLLAEEFGVSRDTMRRALAELQADGLIQSRQGSGSRVIGPRRTPSIRPGRRSGLGELIGWAFEQSEATLDVFTLTTQSLDAHIRLQAERIRMGEASPERIGLRVLLPSEELPLPYPRVRTDPHDPRPVDRLRSITRQCTSSLRSVFEGLGADGLVPQAGLEIRHVPLAPAFKLYLLNGMVALHGMYDVIERVILLDDDEEVDALDVVGLGATLTQHVKNADPHSQGTVFVESMQSWFDSVWDNIASP